MVSASLLHSSVVSMPISAAAPVVFVVDDDISVRESLELLIRSEGWEPRLFATAQAFLAYPPVPVPSCLVLDVRLPGLDGITGHGDVPMTVKAMKAVASCARWRRGRWPISSP